MQNTCENCINWEILPNKTGLSLYGICQKTVHLLIEDIAVIEWLPSIILAGDNASLVTHYEHSCKCFAISLNDKKEIE